MISKEVKAQLTAEYGKTPTDTGSPAVQVAILTYRIKEFNWTFKEQTTKIIIQEEVFLRW